MNIRPVLSFIRLSRRDRSVYRRRLTDHVGRARNIRNGWLLDHAGDSARDLPELALRGSGLAVGGSRTGIRDAGSGMQD
jgi:hypothetical protein